jgi:hypothetical protein
MALFTCNDISILIEEKVKMNQRYALFVTAKNAQLAVPSHGTVYTIKRVRIATDVDQWRVVWAGGQPG